MPFESQAQAKWAFATKQPWARKWGKLTRARGGIKSLPQYVTRKGRKFGKRRGLTRKEVPSATPAAGNASGPEGLFSSAGLEKGIRSAVTLRKRAVRPERRMRPSISYKEGEGHTGAMIALYLSLDAASTVSAAAARMFGERTEPMENLHITLAYLGKVTDPGFEAQMVVVVPLVQKFVQTWLTMVGMPLIGALRGYNYFPSPYGDGNLPYYRVVDSPLLQLWVGELKNLLDMAGVTTHRDFEPYTPHVTVAYSYPELAEIIRATPAAVTPVQFEKVTLALGDTYIDLPLAVATYKAVATEPKGGKPTQPSKPAAGGSGPAPGLIAPGVYRIHGNLCQVHGKFGPCDSASSEGFDKKPKKGKGGGKAKLSDADRKAKRAADKQAAAQEAETQRVQNRTNALGAMASRPNDKAMETLDTLAKGGQPDGAMLKSMESTGLVQKHSDGSYTLSSGGHAFLRALDKGDAAGANEAIAGGKDKIAADTERQTSRAQVLAERNAAKLNRQQSMAKRDAERQKRIAARANDKASKNGTKKPKGGDKNAKIARQNRQVVEDPKQRAITAAQSRGGVAATPPSSQHVQAAAPGKPRVEPIPDRRPGIPTKTR